MLRCALLGYDPAAHDLAQVALDSENMNLVAHCYVPAGVNFSSTDQALPHPMNWEWLLHDDSVDAVIVGQDHIPQREDTLRKLTQVGKPLLLSFPPCEALFAFELEMNRRDGGGPLLIYLPALLHPLTRQLQLLREQLGEIELVSIDRQLTDCQRDSVREAFSADVPLLRSLLGRITQISATGVTQQSSDEANLAITLQNEARGVGRWSVEPAAAPGATLHLRGSAGRAQLLMATSPDQWKLELPSGEVIDFSQHEAVYRPAEAALEELRAALEPDSQVTSWDQVCRDLEVADMIDHSLRRSRTIELYGDEVSERSTFKGIMSAGGCFLLLLAPLVLLVVAVVEGVQAPFRHHFLWRLWPVYLLVPILVFLLLQLLQLAITKPGEKE